ncbi:tetratricopeptide repeat protein [Prevotella intermedia]|uniref:Uncharacterized protein n=1 Tax=Prevotella intermedia TaxID=28131 RepID=A0A2D3LL83_PREIN|nr:tetratricopeptide repeat protein [Prevotella intermedia]ATV31395.1 hypothetical protein CTM46_08075 [Prevotella intermedia]PJI22348.1 hypothetical protein CTM45_02955 [Prevotella intermedia]
MKKLIMAVMMLIGTSAAFAGDSEPLKAIMKAQNYAEAANLLQSTLDQLAGNDEKAKAYNRLYELAMKKVNYEQGIQLENETQKQMGKEGNRPVDEKGLYMAAGAAFDSGIEAIKYDNLPNQKGKVKPKFSGLVEQVYKLRPTLINAGIYFQGKDEKMAYKYLAEYVESADYPEFIKFKEQDQNLTEIAYFATIYAYQNNDFAKAEKYVEYALKNQERAKEAQNLKLAIIGSQLKSRQDSIAYAEKLESIYAQDPSNEAVLSTLASTYNALRMNDKAMQIIDNHLAKDPNSYSALVLKGQFESVKKNYDGAVTALKKALPLASDESAQIAINASIGQCLFYKAQERVMAVKNLTKEARAQFNVVYNEAISYLEKAKELDTTKQNKNLWAYPLYGSYYFVKGPQAPETKALAADAGYEE